MRGNPRDEPSTEARMTPLTFQDDRHYFAFLPGTHAEKTMGPEICEVKRIDGFASSGTKDATSLHDCKKEKRIGTAA